MCKALHKIREEGTETRLESFPICGRLSQLEMRFIPGLYILPDLTLISSDLP